MSERQSDKKDGVVSVLNGITLVNADCLHMRAFLPTIRYDLVYADPPFFTNCQWTSKSRIKSIKGKNQFEDKFASQSHYEEWLTDRVKNISRCMSSRGIFCLHLDHHGISSGYRALEKVFGIENYVGEIVWTYGLGGGKAGANYAHKHDTLLLWAKDASKVQVNQEVISKFGTVWDIQSLNPMSLERVGYPTQKPLELLSRLLDLFPQTNSLVDPFCGSGTTLVAGALKGIGTITGFDMSPNALKVCGFRLKQFAVPDSTNHSLLRRVEAER
jgi:site-specific DNA-methyltransferase (adenine-specific)